MWVGVTTVVYFVTVNNIKLLSDVMECVLIKYFFTRLGYVETKKNLGEKSAVAYRLHGGSAFFLSFLQTQIAFDAVAYLTYKFMHACTLTLKTNLFA